MKTHLFDMECETPCGEKAPMLIDCHAHLEMEQFEQDRADVLKRAQDAGVEYIVTTGTDLPSSRKGVELAERCDSLYATVGVHPHEVKGMTDSTCDELRELAKNPRVVAIGEIGLDYHYLHSPRDVQVQRFREQIRLARELALPIVVHTRKAWEETFLILESEHADQIGGVFHCFTGDEEAAHKALSMNFYISFSGILTFSEPLQKVAQGLHLENLLIETDSPYLAPHPHRGKRNEPAYCRHVAEKLAELKAPLTLEDIARVTSFNARALFGLGLPPEGTISYQIRNSLYLNLTNRCTDACTFCDRFRYPFVKGYNLRVRKEPSSQDLIQAIGDPTRYEEVVFCGYGEPMLRLDVIKEVAAWVKARGGKVRINTNGHAALIHHRNVLPEIAGLVDAVSVSLNAENAEKYYELCRPVYGIKTYEKIKEFIREAKQYIPEVVTTVVDLPLIDVGACEKIATEELGVKFRRREYNVLG